MKKVSDPSAQTAAIASEYKAFVYSVSHDLSAPIRGMVEFSKLLKAEFADKLNDDGQLYLSLIVESGQKLQNMLAGLLKYSRLNTVPIAIKTVSITDVVGRCKKILKDKIEAAHAQITMDALPPVHADAEQMEQLFLALLENAILYRNLDAPPNVHISAQKTPEGQIFTIRDNGIGIVPDLRESVFQPFKRLHGDNEYAGVGMGLAVARKILDCHDGRIWIDPESNAGTAFQFLIPLAGE